MSEARTAKPRPPSSYIRFVHSRHRTPNRGPIWQPRRRCRWHAAGGGARRRARGAICRLEPAARGQSVHATLLTMRRAPAPLPKQRVIRWPAAVGSSSAAGQRLAGIAAASARFERDRVLGRPISDSDRFLTSTSAMARLSRRPEPQKHSRRHGSVVRRRTRPPPLRADRACYRTHVRGVTRFEARRAALHGARACKARPRQLPSRAA